MNIARGQQQQHSLSVGTKSMGQGQVRARCPEAMCLVHALWNRKLCDRRKKDQVLTGSQYRYLPVSGSVMTYRAWLPEGGQSTAQAVRVRAGDAGQGVFVQRQGTGGEQGLIGSA